MLKRLLYFLIAFALLPSAVEAKNLSGIKIYLNPGHGGYYNGANTEDGSLKNDRNVPTIPFEPLDENGFWESSCNLIKGLELKRLLENAGATVMLSRTENREIDDKPLNEISEEANTFGADMFLSVHSNALGANPGVNYLLHLYNLDADGIGKDPTVMELSKKMATEAAPYTIDNQLTVWSPSTPKIVEDNAFLGYTLGVLRNLSIPGFLCEGSFHDYEPETHRLLNKDYAKLSSVMLYRFICDYFGAEKPSTGIIAGTVKDSKRVMTHPRFNNYVKKTHDRYQPLNGAKVTLLDASNNEIKTYTTDQYYNGVFVFWDLTPGTYTVRMEQTGYISQEKTVEVKAAATTGFYTLLEDPAYEPPAAIQGIPNIFASALNATLISDGKYKVSFLLNADATNVSIKVYNGIEIIKEIEYGSRPKGCNEVELDITDVSGEGLTWSVEATANSTEAEAPLKFTDDEQKEMSFKTATGIAIDNHTESAFFGRIYVSEAEGGAVIEKTTSQGLYIYDPTFADVTSQGDKAYDGNAGFVVGNKVSPFRPFVGEDGLVYITDWTDTHSGIWVMNPANPSADFAPIFSEGTINSDGLHSVNGVNVNGSISHCWVAGTGSDRVLYTFDEDYSDAPVVNKCSILRYDIGALVTPWDKAPSAVVFNNADKLEQNGNSKIAPDGRGGWWISQYRYSDSATIPSLIHINVSGVVDYNSSGTMISSIEGGMSVNHDGTLIAMACGDAVKIFNIAYDDAGTPTLTQAYVIDPALGTRTFDIAFDVADNIYVATRDAGIGAWAFPKENNSFETKAPSTITLKGSSSVESVLSSGTVFSQDGEILHISSANELQHVVIYSAAGKVVLQIAVTGCKADIDLSGLADGVYMVNTANAKKKIVK